MVLVSNLFALRFRFLLILFVISCFGIDAKIIAQQNPFEIKSSGSLALKSNDTASLQQKDTNLHANILIRNPFETRPGLNSRDSISNALVPKKNLFPSFDSSRITEVEIKNFIFWIILFLTFMLALALNMNREITGHLFKSVVNLNSLNVIYRENKEQNRFIFYLLYSLYILGLSLFIYLAGMYYKGNLSPWYLLVIIVSVSLIYVIRHLSLALFGAIFGIQKETSKLIFHIILFGSMMAIILVPMDFIITFTQRSLSNKLIISVIVISIVLFIARYVRDILLTLNLWKNSIFHFLLYLCSFEIAPLIFLYYILKNQGVIT